MIGLGTPVRAAVEIAADDMPVPAGAIGLTVKGVQLGHGWHWVKFAERAPMLVHGREIVAIGANMILVITRAKEPAVADVFVFDKSGNKWAHQGISVPEATDIVVEQNGRLGLPVFWNGEPYLDEYIPPAPAVPA